MTYDRASRELLFDDLFAVAPVSVKVVSYEVNGMNVLLKWFGYRKRDPEGRHTAGLSSIHLETWPAEYTTELLELLNVLAQLVKLAPQQETALERVVSGPLIDWAELVTRITQAEKPEGRSPRLCRQGSFN